MDNDRPIVALEECFPGKGAKKGCGEEEGGCGMPMPGEGSPCDKAGCNIPDAR